MNSVQSKSGSAWQTFCRINAGLFLLVLIFSCEAPRNNPLDPQNPGNKYRYLNGTVETYSLPRKPLESAELRWMPGNQSVFSTDKGSFEIETIINEKGWLTCNREGYLPDSIFIAWEAKKVTAGFILNRIPVADTSAVFSQVINRYPDLQTQRLYLQSGIGDDDNDVDSVHFIYQKTGFRTALKYNLDSGFYETNLSPAELGLQNLAELVGQPLSVEVLDKFGHHFLLPIQMLHRVINQEVVLLAPRNSEVTGIRPTFRWQPFNPGFSFRLRLEVYTRDVVQQLVWSRDLTDQQRTELEMEVNLPVEVTDQYFWILWAFDEFGNQSLSKQASFIARED